MAKLFRLNLGMEMAKSTWIGGLAAIVLIPSAMAAEPTVKQAASLLHYSHANDRMRLEVSPNYSEQLGWSLRGAAATSLSESAAIGVLVEYGSNKREYLSNLGFGLSDTLSLIGTVGMLEEHSEYVDGEDRRKVQQMEYGLSLKGAYDVGPFSNFELNSYLADAKTDSASLEAGKLYGMQLLTRFDLGDATHLKIGGGHEWLRWDLGQDDETRFTFSAEGTRHLSDSLGIHARAKLGVSENIYGGGLTYDLGESTRNTLGLNYSLIDGRNEIEDDQRVMLGWTVSLGSETKTENSTFDGSVARPAAQSTVAATGNELLSDVMKRPSYLPERVLAKSAASGSCASLGMIIKPLNDQANPNKFGVATGNPSSASVSIISTTVLPASITIGSSTLTGVSLVSPIPGSYYTAYLLTVPVGTFVPGEAYTMTLTGAVNCQQVLEAVAIL